MCYLNKRNPHPVISVPTPYTLGASGTAVWIVISGCRKFTAQTALGYEDRLSPQLLMLLSYSSTGENQFHGFLFFFFPFDNCLLPLFQGESRTSLRYCISREGRVKAGAASSYSCIWDSSFYTTILFYAIFIMQPSSFLLSSFWTRSSFLPSPLILVPPSLHPHTHGVITVLRCLMSSTLKRRVEAMKQEEKISCFLLD